MVEILGSSFCPGHWLFSVSGSMCLLMSHIEISPIGSVVFTTGQGQDVPFTPPIPHKIYKCLSSCYGARKFPGLLNCRLSLGDDTQFESGSTEQEVVRIPSPTGARGKTDRRCFFFPP